MAHTGGAARQAHFGAAHRPPHHHGAAWVAIHGLTTQDFKTPRNPEEARMVVEAGPVSGGPLTVGSV